MTTTDTIDPELDPTEPRDRLRAAIEAVESEEQRLAALTEARDRARQQLRESTAQLTDYQHSLNAAITDQRQHLAYSYLNNGDLIDDPVAIAKSNVTSAEQETDRYQEIDAALTDEMRRVQVNLRDLKLRLYIAMSEVVVSSPEYQQLISQHKQAWQNLRTIKIALRAVASGLHGQLPHKYSNISELSEPTDATAVSYTFDKDFVKTWVTAMAHLTINPDAPLPTKI